MGMFDYIRSEVKLPDGFCGELQTKDFNCEMCTHVIRADGRLILQRVDRTDIVPKAERPYPNAADDDILSICGSLRSFKSTYDANFHGIVNFYGGDGNDWHEYKAKFTDGNLVSIEQIKEQ